MTDLEIIKNDLAFIENCEMTCEIGCHERFKNIYEAAERMAARIEELSTRPEVVRCGECLESQMGDCGLMCLRHDFMAVSENDYCSRGVRKAKGEE